MKQKRNMRFALDVFKGQTENQRFNKYLIYKKRDKYC